MWNFVRIILAGQVLLTAVLLTAVVAPTLAEEMEPPGEVEEAEHSVKVADVPVVKTINGKVSGVKEQSIGGKTFYSFHSIPYAQPPVGELRFKDPLAVENWDDVRDGSQMPPLCPQYTLDTLMTGRSSVVEGKEDCLFVNIYTPKPYDSLSLLPVMVFIHGGAWMSGGAREYPPHVLMDHDIVLVTIQYRLGVLGFLSTEDDAAPGNLGLKDQTLALTWVQWNVHNFGGDPLKITLFGESAGAGSIHFQILSHKSLGLFQQAILQSGSALCPWSLGGAHAAVAEYTGSLFNCTTDETHQLISCLQAVDVNDLVPVLFHFTKWHMVPLLLGPRVDGNFIPSEPEQLMKESRHKNVHLISGINQHEGAFITLPMFANEALRSSLKYDFPNKGPLSLEFTEGDIAPLNQTVKIFDHYLGGVHLDIEHADRVTQMYSDRFFSVCHDLTSSLHAKNVAKKEKKTFRYELMHRGQRSAADIFSLDIGHNWVTHMDDLFYLFSGGPLWTPLERKEDLKLRNIITTLWTNFAKTGNPTPDDSLGFRWDPVNESDFRHLSLRPSPTMQDDYRQQTREFWSSLPLKQNLILNPEGVENIVYVPAEETENQTSEAVEETEKETSEAVEETEKETSQPVEDLQAEEDDDSTGNKEEVTLKKDSEEENKEKIVETENKEKDEL
ncbi:carboxylic ester hydrolase isoform X3 [Cherax quadricarinatus]